MDCVGTLNCFKLCAVLANDSPLVDSQARMRYPHKSPQMCQQLIILGGGHLPGVTAEVDAAQQNGEHDAVFMQHTSGHTVVAHLHRGKINDRGVDQLLPPESTHDHTTTKGIYAALSLNQLNKRMNERANEQMNE